MKVASGTVVELEYRLHLGDNEVVDESGPGDPLQYLHGVGQIVPGLEHELEGMSEGESKKVVVAAADGYGEHDARGLQEVPRAAFPSGANISVGMQFYADAGGGEQVPVTVREVKADSIVIDMNHPLAGKELHFDVTVRGVRQATQEELAHGHAHGPGGHH